MSDRRETRRNGRRVVPGEAGPLAVVIEGFWAVGLCRQVAELADELYEAHELVENVFQSNAWFSNLGQPETARPADARWKVVERLHQDVIGALGIGSWGPDTSQKDFLSYICTGGFVVRHRDDWQMASREFDCRVRCNVFVQKEPGSGDPCLGPEEGNEGSCELRLGLSTGDLLVFSPSMTPHRATRVLGEAKVMVSFGLEVTKGSFHEALERLASPVSAPAA
jgi:hypothetical protein